MPSVLVTGGSGFIGSHVVDRLLAAGHAPVIFDVRPSEHHRRTRCPSCAATSPISSACCDAMRGCDAVDPPGRRRGRQRRRGRDPLDAEERNARGTLNALEAARRGGVERFIYASTIWVYSDTPAECHEESLALQPPAHIYSATKLAGELYCRSYGELYGLESTILRFGIPYGPRARPNAVIPAFVAQGARGRAADRRRRRLAVAPVRLRGGPRRRRGAPRSTRWPRAAPTTSSAPRTSASRRSRRPSARRSATWRSSACRAATATTPARR